LNVTNSSSSKSSGACTTEELHIRRDGKESPFINIPMSLWFTEVTMTMVGYGEMTPVSYGGRVVAIVAGICGLIFWALPLTILGTHFIISIKDREMEKLIKVASNSATVFNVLSLVNEVLDMQLFKLRDQLPFLSPDANLAMKEKIENVILFTTGWAYLPYSTKDAAGIARLTQFKLFVLFGIFGKKVKKIRSVKQKQIQYLNSEFQILNQKPSRSRPQTIKIVDYSDVEDNNHDFSSAKRSSSVNFMNRVSNDSPILRTTRRSSGGKAVSFMGEDYGSPRKLVEYCSFGEVKTNEPLDNSLSRTDYESGSASVAISGIKSYKTNPQEWV